MQAKFTILVFFAVYAMILTTTTVDALRKPHFNKLALKLDSATTAMVKLCHSYLDTAGLKLSSNVCASVSSTVSLSATGLVKSELTTKSKDVTGKLEGDIDLAIHQNLDAFFDSSFYSKLNAGVRVVLDKHCGSAADFGACLKTHATLIARELSKVSASITSSVSGAFKDKFQSSVNTAVDVCFKEFQVNLLVEKISVGGSVQFKTKANTHLLAWLKATTKETAWAKVLSKGLLSLTA